MQNETTDATTGADQMLASMPFHPTVGSDSSIDACPFGALIKGMNGNPDVVFSILAQYFGGGEFDDEDTDEDTP